MTIKRCPFCGSPSSVSTSFGIQCSLCKAKGPTWSLDCGDLREIRDLKNIITWNIRSDNGFFGDIRRNCPFCGSNYVFVEMDDNYMLCENCGTNGPISKVPRDTYPRDEGLKKDIHELWDNRTTLMC